MLSKKLLESLPLAICALRTISTENVQRSLSLQQLRMLRLVQEGFGQTQMALTLQVSLAAVSKMVESLVKKDLMTRKVGKDKRVITLKLTSKGSKLLNQVMMHLEETLNQGIKFLTLKEQEQLLEGLLVLDKLIEKVKKG